MENNPTYAAGPGPVLATCPTCGVRLGYLYIVNGRTRLRVGNLELYAAHGICRNCDSEYHWTAGEVMLKRLIEKTVRK